MPDVNIGLKLTAMATGLSQMNTELESLSGQLKAAQATGRQGIFVDTAPAVASFEELRTKGIMLAAQAKQVIFQLEATGGMSDATAAQVKALAASIATTEQQFAAFSLSAQTTVDELEQFQAVATKTGAVVEQLGLGIGGVGSEFTAMGRAAVAGAATAADAMKGLATATAVAREGMFAGFATGGVTGGGFSGQAGQQLALGLGSAGGAGITQGAQFMNTAMYDAGNDIRNFGRKIVSVGYSSTISAGILDAVLMMAAGGAAKMDDSIQRVATAASGTPEQIEKLKEDIKNIGSESSVPLRDTIAGAYNFYSSLPPQFKIIDDAHRQWANQMFANNLKLKVIGDGLNMDTPIEKVMLNMNAALSQFFPNAKPEDMLGLNKQIADTFTNVMLHTSTEIGLFGDSLRIIGPMAHQMGISFQQTSELLAVLAEFKVRGAPAGQSLKRIFSREIAPTGAQAKDVAYLQSQGIDISLFDKTTGKMRNFYDVLDSINKVLATSTQADKGKIVKDIAGLWAIPQLGALLSHEKAVGVSGMTREAQQITKPGSTDTAYNKRFGDLQQQMQHTFNMIEHAGLDVVQAMAPGLIELLHHINSLVAAFERLSPGTKKFIGDMLLAGAATLTIFGPLTILGGSLIKIVGTLMMMPTSWEGVTAAIGRFAGTSDTVGTSIATRLLPAIEAVAPRLLGLLGPIGLVAGAALLIYEAWHKDWGHIQEVVEHFGTWITAWLPFELGSIAGKTAQGLQEIWYKFSVWAGNLIVDLEAWGKKMLHAWGDALHDEFVKAWPIIDDLISGKFSDLFHRLANAAKRAGQSIAANLSAGFHANYHGSDAVAAGAGMINAHAIRAAWAKAHAKRLGPAPTVNAPDPNEVQPDGAVPNLGLEGAGKAKVKKQTDDIINIGRESVDRIVAFAHEMAAKLKAAGAQIKMGWIDLVDATGHITRVYGNVKAMEMAVAASKDHSVQQAEALLRRAREWHNSVLEQYKKLQQFESTVTSPDDRAAINGMLAALAYKLEKTATADVTGVGKDVTKTQGFDSKFQSDLANYQARLNLLINTRKNQELPTLQELNKEYVLELGTRQKLQADLEKEITARDEAEKKLKAAKDAVDQLSAAGLTNTQAYKDAAAKVTEYSDTLNGLNNQILGNQTAMAQLNDSIDKNAALMLKAADAATKFGMDLAASLTAGMRSGLNGVFGEIESSMDNFMKKMFVGGGAVSTFIRDAFKGAMSNALQIVSGGLTANFQTWFSKAMGLGTREDPAGKALVAAANHAVHTHQQILQIHATKIHNAHIHAVARHLLAADHLQKAADAIVAAAGGGPGSSFGSPQQVAMGPIGSDVNYGANPLTQNDYVLDDSLSAQQTIADQTSQLVSLFSNSSTPGVAGVAAAGGAAGTVGVGGVLGSADSLFGGLFKGGAAAGIKKYMGNAAIGLGVGDMFGSLMQGGDTGTHQIWGQLGGALGALFGPAGGAIGGILGGLFGHTNDPNKMPDQYGISSIGLSSQGYQQWLSTFNGGQGDVISQLQGFIAGKGMNGLTGPQLAIFQQLKALGGPGNNLGVASEKNGVFTLGSGQQISAADFIKLTTSAQTIMEQVNANKISAAANAAALADSFITRIINAPQGFVMPGLVSGFAGGAPVVGGGTSGFGGGFHRPIVGGTLVPRVGTTIGNGSTGGSGGGTIHMHILEGATITANLAEELNKAIPDITNALADAVNKANFLSNRRTGNYISAL